MMKSKMCLAWAIATASAAWCSAQTFMPDDALGVTTAFGDGGVSILGAGDGFTGIDDTFEGTFSVTWTASVTNSGDNAAFGLDIVYGGGSSRRIEVGEFWDSEIWGFWQGENAWTPLTVDGTNSVTLTSSPTETLTLMIDFVAGGDDSGSILFQGYETAITTGDYSFEEIWASSFNIPVDYKDISVSIVAVPEPSFVGAWLGALACFAVIGRRRRRS